MGNPLEILKKLKGRSLKEIRTRGEQAVSVYSERIGFAGKIPSDRDFFSVIDKKFLGGETIDAESLRAAFYRSGKSSFFQSFADAEKTLAAFNNFGDASRRAVIERAEKILEGKFSLLGYKNLDFNLPVNWHYEPLSRKHLPIKHWKQFDELDTTETGDKKIVWELNRHQHFFTLGVAYWLTRDEIYAETFARHLEGWMALNPPGTGINWFSSLEVAMRSISWLWAFHFFKDAKSFKPEIFLYAIKYLYLHGQHIEKYLSTYYSPNTHLTGEALGLYYLGTQLPFLPDAQRWRALGEDILFAELDRQIWDDGVYFEQSTWYARYTADFYTHYLLLRNLNGENNHELTAKLNAKLQSLLDFLMYVTRPDGTTPLIGDDDGGRMLPHSARAPNDFRATLATGAVLFERGDYKFVAREFSEETVWLLGAKSEKTFEILPAHKPGTDSKEFKTGGYYIMRDGWEATDNYLLMDAGPMGALAGAHSHADTLSIDLAVGGRTMLVDAGTYSYHESDKVRNYFRSTVAHNTLSIDKKSSSEFGGKFKWQTLANAALRSWIADRRFDFFEGSHDGFRRLPAPAEHARAVLFLKNDYWIVRDYVETLGEHDYQLNFHFDAGTNPMLIENEDGGDCAVEKTDGQSGLHLCSFGDNGVWRARENWISDCYGNQLRAPFFQFLSHGKGAQEFFTFLLPTILPDDEPRVRETEIEGGRAFVINFHDYQDIFVYADGDRMIRTEFFSADFRFVWARLSNGDELPEEFVMINGKNFILRGREIINFHEGFEFLSARRLGNKLNARTDKTIFTVSLPDSQPRSYNLKPF
jgi:hypothetical protein